jgi:hypothetical protein
MNIGRPSKSNVNIVPHMKHASNLQTKEQWTLEIPVNGLQSSSSLHLYKLFVTTTNFIWTQGRRKRKLRKMESSNL